MAKMGYQIGNGQTQRKKYLTKKKHTEGLQPFLDIVNEAKKQKLISELNNKTSTSCN